MTARPWWLWLATASFVSYYVLVTLSIHHARPGYGVQFESVPSGASVLRVFPGTPADRAGFAPGDRPVVVNGWALNGPYDPTILQAAYPTGVPVEWVVERAGARTTLVLEPLERRWVWQTAMWVVVGVSLLTSLVMGLLIAFRGDGRPTTLLAAWLLASIGCVTLPIWPRSMAFDWAQLPLPLGLLMWPAAVSAIAVPILLFTFCALVPRPVLSTRRLMIAQIPLALIVLFVVAISTLMVYSPGRAMSVPFPIWLQVGGPLSYGLYTVGAALLMLISLRRAADVTERRRVLTLLTGAAAGALGLLLLGAGFAWPRLSSAAQMTSGGVIFSIMPLAFAYATLRHRLFDLRVIVRLGLQYALARGLIVALIPITLLVLAVDIWLHADQSVASIMASRGWNYAAVASIVSVVFARRHKWMPALDRRFFRERYEAHQILKGVVEDVGQSPDFDTGARKVVARIHSALHPVMAAVMKRPRTATAFSAAAKLPEGAPLTALLSGNAITQVVRALGRPVVFGPQGLRDIPADHQAWLAESQVEVVVPIATDSSRDEAVLVLGPRKSEEPYSREDLDLLATIGASLGLLIGRSTQGETVTVISAAGLGKLANRYRLERPIGEGGMGVVFAGVDETLERPVAIKLIKDQHLTGDALARFQREARTAASLAHPHIVTVHDFGVDDKGSPFLVMELLEGQSLRAAIKTGGRMPAARAMPILSGLAAAIEAAHAKGIIHRDLKPENVFLVGKTMHAKILDYGIAKALESKTTFATPGVLGTLAYMAPEQAGGGEASPAWDVWALSVIAFEMLTGQHPFNGGLPVTNAIPIRTLAPDLSDAIATAIDRALSLNPSSRPATAGDLIHSLQS